MSTGERAAGGLKVLQRELEQLSETQRTTGFPNSAAIAKRAANAREALIRTNAALHKALCGIPQRDVDEIIAHNEILLSKAGGDDGGKA